IARDNIFREPNHSKDSLAGWMGKFWHSHQAMTNRGATAIISQPIPLPAHTLLPENTSFNPTPAIIHAIAVPDNVDLLLHRPLEQVKGLVAAVTTAHRHTTAGTNPNLDTTQGSIERSVDLRTKELMSALCHSHIDPQEKLASLLDERLGIHSAQLEQMAVGGL
ncbi:hypothetical protein KKH13_00905, partial [Patescibacteria group bacterium]|nr:hypothetical protein [Patescibacteria group bacterium]